MGSEECNKLGEEKSPYLLQHKSNPVCWYPWGDEAFEEARKQNKPIFLSIGYSTCYWCHVMEKDSFEIEEVAKVLNKYFISVKVDREERPDVDQIYMDAVVSMRGSGGWPMSVFLTPDRKPFWGGTFFYRQQFINILENIHETWTSEKEKIETVGDRITDYIGSRGKATQVGIVDESAIKTAVQQYKESFDKEFGGFGGAPKFPPSMQIAFLLRYHRRFGDKEALHEAVFTLEKMARGGIYDHLGGGFARYSTDAKWLVPHFEKMLYDNALLATVYLEGYQVTGSELFKSVATETLDYVLREMTSSEGGFYSAQDAGEVGKEGEFYVWSFEELKGLLSAEELAHAGKVYGVTENGNFEHNNVLTLQSEFDWKVKTEPLTAAIHEKLLAIRNKREHPHKDDKVLTAWNGLMITAFAKGYQVLGDERYLKAAQGSAKFIKDKLFNGKSLLRRYREGEARFEAYLDDYAFLIEGLIHLYESDFDPEWLRFAERLQKQQDEKFWDDEEAGYVYSAAPDVIVKKKEFTDGALPSGNSVALLSLLRLHGLLLEKEHSERAEQLLGAFYPIMVRYPSAVPTALKALEYKLDNSKEVAVIVGDEPEIADKIRSFVYKTFQPNLVLSVGKPAEYPTVMKLKTAENGRTTIYVCEKNTCKLPTSNLEKAKKLISGG